MIDRLFIDKRPDGLYLVVCNGYFAFVSADQITDTLVTFYEYVLDAIERSQPADGDAGEVG